VGCLLTQKLRLRAQEPQAHPDQRLDQSPGMGPMGWRCTSRNGKRWWSWFIRDSGDEISWRESHAIGQQRRIEPQAPD
jgi:hypothetical protein